MRAHIEKVNMLSRTLPGQSSTSNQKYSQFAVFPGVSQATSTLRIKASLSHETEGEGGGADIPVCSYLLQASVVLKKVCEYPKNRSNASFSSKKIGHIHETKHFVSFHFMAQS